MMKKKLLVLSGIVTVMVQIAGCGSKTESQTAFDVGKSYNTTESVAMDGMAECVEAVDGMANYGEDMVVSEPDWNTEEYDKVEEKGFTAVTNQPLSTFSADVDTASYSNIRRMIEDGYPLEDIPKGAVRIEEMLNYFSYDYITNKKYYCGNKSVFKARLVARKETFFKSRVFDNSGNDSGIY